MIQWSRMMTNKGWRVYPTSIHETYVKSLGGDNGTTQPTSELHIDMPGMIMVDRSYQKFEFDGLLIEIPSQDFPIMHAQLSGAKVEILPGGTEVVKLRGWIAGLVMLPAQRERLLRIMGEMLPSVKLIAQREDQEFARRIQSINEKSPVKVISARAEKVKKDGPGNEKPN